MKLYQTNYSVAAEIKTEVDRLYQVARSLKYEQCQQVLERADHLWAIAKNLEHSRIDEVA